MILLVIENNKRGTDHIICKDFKVDFEKGVIEVVKNDNLIIYYVLCNIKSYCSKEATEKEINAYSYFLDNNCFKEQI